MEDQLRLFLLLGGTVFIIAVLAHGIWKIRKNSKPSEKERLEPRQWQDDDNDFESDEQEGFDELGIGAVRVVSKSQNQEHEAASNVSTNTANGPAHHDINEKHAYSSEELDDVGEEQIERIKPFEPKFAIPKGFENNFRLGGWFNRLPLVDSSTVK